MKRAKIYLPHQLFAFALENPHMKERVICINSDQRADTCQPDETTRMIVHIIPGVTISKLKSLFDRIRPFSLYIDYAIESTADAWIFARAIATNPKLRILDIDFRHMNTHLFIILFDVIKESSITRLVIRGRLHEWQLETLFARNKLVSLNTKNIINDSTILRQNTSIQVLNVNFYDRNTITPFLQRNKRGALLCRDAARYAWLVARRLLHRNLAPSLYRYVISTFRDPCWVKALKETVKKKINQ
jgi:hypothetical protein